ncbi:MAG: hypothetical protein N2260_07555 [Syntrophobacterales bacterium]|nr:hypothetical protein [Syntrophobacterales bacterium]
MAKIIYAHPKLRGYDFHLFTDLDFWDARKVLKDLLEFLSVRRNFGVAPPGDEFPTQIVIQEPTKEIVSKVENRLRKAIPSPPRHVVVRHMIFDGYFVFDPAKYYPKNWSKEKIEHFTWCRLPLDQTSLCNPYETVVFEWHEKILLVRRVKRSHKHDPKITSNREKRKWCFIPSAF